MPFKSDQLLFLVTIINNSLSVVDKLILILQNHYVHQYFKCVPIHSILLLRHLLTQSEKVKEILVYSSIYRIW